MSDQFWCLVENGSVILGPRALPLSYGQVSNFYALGDSELYALNWRKYRLVVTVQPDQIVIGGSWQITSTEAIETQLVRNRTPEEIAENIAP
jgi:hypothetical protein